MDSIKTIYKIGYGPSSSHTMGPAYASETFLKRNINATKFVVELYGSLALTGAGHLTDTTVKKILGEYRTDVIFRSDITYTYHPNGMKLYAYQDNTLIDEWLVFSVGGGDLKELNEDREKFEKEVYPHKNMSEIMKYIKDNNMSLLEYIKTFEDDDLYLYLETVFQTMEDTIHNGMRDDVIPILPGSLELKRKARQMYKKYQENNDFNVLLFALTLSTCEENASGGKICTAPTCGSAGIIPGIIFSEYYYNHVAKDRLLDCLAIAGLICNIVKTNASISGAEVGCQGEVGVACAAASGMLAYLKGYQKYEGKHILDEYIEYASEIALEHHLGMTCDPIDGLVQIPCIERNAMAAEFAYSSSNYALMTTGEHYVTLDSVIKVMDETGKDIHQKYKETSTGGLATNAKK